MKIITKVALSAAVLAGLAFAPTAALAATTPPLPKIQAYQVTGWTGMVQRPGHIQMGRGGLPTVYQLTWSRWTLISGKATGKLALTWCIPTSSCQPNVHAVTAWANTLRNHAGMAYFSLLVYQYVNAEGVTKQLRFWFCIFPVGSVPSWSR